MLVVTKTKPDAGATHGFGSYCFVSGLFSTGTVEGVGLELIAFRLRGLGF